MTIETLTGDDLIWSKVKQVSWRWSDEQRSAEFARHFGIEPSQASTEQLLEFLWAVGFHVGSRRTVCNRPHYPVSRENEYGIDYSDLHADGPSTTADEAWANVGAYLAQQDRALSAYAVHPDAHIEIADEITPTHVLRWSSLRVLFAEHEQEATR